MSVPANTLLTMNGNGPDGIAHPGARSGPVAFYAPLKSPDSPRPSGDRLIARALFAALEAADLRPVLVSRLRTLDLAGDRATQRTLEAQAAAQADAMIAKWQACPHEQRPRAFVTYHLYYKAPDLIGPRVARALAIPHVVVEASISDKRRDGPWAPWLAVVIDAVAHADLVVHINPKDAPAIATHRPPDRPTATVPPFRDLTAFTNAYAARATHRHDVRQRLGLSDETCVLMSAGMMRPGAKMRSYATLAAALTTLETQRTRVRPPGRPPWHVLIAGDGACAADVRAAFEALAPHVTFLGQLDEAAMAVAMAGADRFVWPAIDEALGMVFIEAQAAGLPVIAADRPGVRDLIAMEHRAHQPPEADAEALARALTAALRAPTVQADAASAQAHRHACAHHSLAGGGAAFAALVHDAIARGTLAAAGQPERERKHEHHGRSGGRPTTSTAEAP
ncbi:MAG: glycosyltransferase [Pseudomonadota bacterium]